MTNQQNLSARAGHGAGREGAVERFVRSIENVFRSAHRINFDAPWARRSDGVGCA